MCKLRILLADDREDFRTEFSLWLHDKLGHEVTEVATGDEALANFQQSPQEYDLAIVDYFLEGKEVFDGIELLKQMQEMRRELPVIIITGFGDRTTAKKALQAKAYWYLEKPLDRMEAEVLISSVGRLHHRAEEVAKLRAEAQQILFPSLLGLSQAILSSKSIDDLAVAVAREAPVILEMDECHLSLLHADTGKVKNILNWNVNRGDVIYTRHYKSRLLTSELSNNGQYHFVVDTTQEDDLTPEFIQTEIRSFAATACPPETTGAPVVLHTYSQSTMDEKSALMLKSRLITLARLIGAAYERIRQTELAEAIALSGKELLSAFSQEEINRVLENTLSQSFEVSSYYLALYDKSNTIKFPLAVDKKKRIHASSRINDKENGGLTGYIIRTAQEFGCDNLSDVSNIPVPVVHLGDGESTEAYFGVPLILPDGSIVGVLSIQRQKPRRILDGSKQALRTLSTQTALAINRLKNDEAREEQLTGFLTKPLTHILQEIAVDVKEETDADIVTIHPYDISRDIFTSERIRLGLPDADSTLRFRGTENDALKRLLETKDLGHFSIDSSEDDVFKGRFIKKHNIISSGGVTLTAGTPPVPIGVLVINYKYKHVFDDNLKSILRYFGRRAALAIRVALLAEKERQARQRFQAQNAAFQALHTHNTQRKIVAQVISAIKSAWNIHKISISPSLLLLNRATQELDFANDLKTDYIIDIEGEKERKSIRLGEGICGWVAETGKSEIVSDVLDDSRYLSLIKGSLSEICVPIKLGNRLLGVLDVEASQKHFFEDEDRIFLERIADEFAIELGASGDRKNAKKVIQAAIDALGEPSKALDVLAKRAHEIAGLGENGPISTTIFLLVPTGLQAVSAYPPETLEGVREKLGTVMPLETSEKQPKGIIIRTVLEKKSQLIENVNIDRDYIEFDEKTVAELDVPIFSGNKVIGVLNVEYAKTEDLGDNDRRLLESLAAQASVITTVHKQTSELAEKERQRGEAVALALMGIASVDQGHRWKTAAATVAGTRDLLETHLKKYWGQPDWLVRTGFKGPDRKKVFEWLDRMKRKIEIAQERPQHLSLPTEGKEELLVDEWLEKLISRWMSLEEEVLFGFENLTKERTYIYVNEFWFKRGVENIIANAVRAALSNSNQLDPKVTMRLGIEGETVLITVIDNGDGVPEEVKPFLFSQTIHLGRIGHGVGCLTTQFIIRMYGGKAFLVQSDNYGAVFTIELPRHMGDTGGAM